MATEVGSLLSVEDMLARSKAAADSKSSAAGGSKIQQMIAAMENGGQTDTVSLSPVAQLLKGETTAKSDQVPFTEQEWYINAKVAQLKGQIQMYSTLPGLDPSGAVMDSLTDEVNALVGSQQAKLAKSQAEAAEKQAQLDKIEKEKSDAPMTADAMLKRSQNQVNGVAETPVISKEVQALLDKLKSGSVVNKTA